MKRCVFLQRKYRGFEILIFFGIIIIEAVLITFITSEIEAIKALVVIFTIVNIISLEVLGGKSNV